MDEKKLAAIKENESTTKKSVLSRIQRKFDRYKKEAAESPRFPQNYYSMIVLLLSLFYKRICEAVLFEELPDYWVYGLSYEYDDFSLELRHICEYKIDEDGSFQSARFDAVYKLVTIRPSALSVDEYARVYEVEPVTVRQWIRRGKIRNAYKEGSEWKIPELSPPPKRGYEPAQYRWFNGIENLPEEYSFLSDYVLATFYQDLKEKSKFHVKLVSKEMYASDSPGDVKRTGNKELLLDSKEREKMELFMISHPQIKYCGQMI